MWEIKLEHSLEVKITRPRLLYLGHIMKKFNLSSSKEKAEGSRQRERLCMILIDTVKDTKVFRLQGLSRAVNERLSLSKVVNS